MIPVLNNKEYLAKILETKRTNSENVLAFYEARIGAICTDATLMLAPLDDHLIHRGDGVFETISYKNGKLLQLDAHIERLKQSANGLEINPPHTYAEIKDIILQVAKAGKEQAGSIRLLLGRGEGGFGISKSECPRASLYIVAYKNPPSKASMWEDGLIACRSSIAAKEEIFAKLKTTNYLPNVFMDKEALAKGANVAFSFDNSGYLAEAAIANVAIINKSGEFLIPHFKHTLAGTTAIKAMDILKRNNIVVKHANITEDDIFNAQEVLVLGTGAGCVAAVEYEHRAIADKKPGKIARFLYENLMKEILQEGTEF